ncbi:hypothetical protein HKCCE3408_17550 [Rhodobacterales bacterium HKCCE3408]|nr:hypothetical protein [Rhodobacterales bacterium HKCCE3408]
MRLLALVLLSLLAGPAAAEDPSQFGTCMARVIARFEAEASRVDLPISRVEIDLLRQDRVIVCGNARIVTCDLMEDRVPCQNALAAEEDAMRAEVLAALPEPGDVAGRDGIWSDALYPQLYALAHGGSAGPDCDGAERLWTAWCEAQQSGAALAGAVSAWKLARMLGAVGPAVEAGWVGEPPAPQPMMRPERG